MIEFKVTGETWKEIQEKLKGLFPETKKEKISETTESPPDSFTAQKESVPYSTELNDKPVEPILPLPPVLSSPPDLPTVLDNTGIPWNSEIHTRTKSTNEDGTWRLKRQSPGFEKKKPIMPPGTGITSRSQVTTPESTETYEIAEEKNDTLPSSKKFATLDELMIYITKINDSRKALYEDIRVYLESIGISNVVQLSSTKKFTDTAAALRLKFGVEY